MIDGAIEREIAAGGLLFTSYEMGTGPFVLCVHGFPDTPATFGPLMMALAGSGYRAAAVTLRGYEPSSQPADGNYALSALASDVVGWLDHFHVERAHLIGHDWGASIACAAAALVPHRIETLTAISVAHPSAFAAYLPGDHEQLKRSWYIFFFQLRGLAETIARANDFAFIENLWRDWSPEWRASARYLAAVKCALAKPGVLEAALSYYRTSFDPAAPGLAQTACLLSTPISAPTLGVTGLQDGCVSSDVFAHLMPEDKFQGGVRIARIEGAGHFPHAERPAEVHAAFLQHVKATAARMR